MSRAKPRQHGLVLQQRAGAHAARHDDDVRVRQLVERGVDGQPEEAVVRPDLTAAVADEGDGRSREPLEHFVGTNEVQGGEALEEDGGDLHDGSFLPAQPASVKRRR